MEEWKLSETCPGYREKTIQRGAATIIIRRPVLDGAEQAKREKRAKETLGRVMNNYIRRKGA
jgi:hypothetical protein